MNSACERFGKIGDMKLSSTVFNLISAQAERSAHQLGQIDSNKYSETE